eukprot:12908588-Heterocapsa_arctica.AAC.1
MRRSAASKPSMKDCVKLVIVEFCCGEESHMGEAQHQTYGCEVMSHYEKWRDHLRRTKDGYGGCETAKHLVVGSNALHRWLPMAKHQQMVATVCHAHGGKIAIEWPATCAYWHWQSTVNFVAKYTLNTVKLHGCAVGLKDENAFPCLSRG